MRTIFLVAAVIGTVVPYYFFIQFFADNGLSLVDFVAAGFANGAAGGFTADLLIASFVFWIAMFRRQAKGGPAPWLFMVLNLAIGLSCALPAYLWVSMGKENG